MKEEEEVRLPAASILAALEARQLESDKTVQDILDAPGKQARRPPARARLEEKV